jgi:predicted nucleotidyltransferase
MHHVAGGVVPFNYNEQLALEGLIDEVTPVYHVKKIILYGAKARGDFIEGSDIDLLFVTEVSLDRATKFQISDIIYKYELSNDVIISAIFISEPEFRDKLNIFLMKVKKEGVVIWSKE